MRKVKKIVALILSICMMISVIPVDTYAAESSPVVTQDDASTETDQLNAGSNDNAGSGKGVEDASNTEDSINAASVENVEEQSVTYVAEVNGTKYTQLQDAFDNLSEGQTLKLLEDVDVDVDGSCISVSHSGTLDLNGKKLSGNSVYDGVLYFGTSGVNFTIVDSSEGKTGVIENTCAKPDTEYNLTQAVQVWCSDGTVDLTISGGTFKSKGTYAVYADSNGTLKISGGNFEKAICITDGDCTISGGTFKSTDTYAVYDFSSGTLTIAGGSFESSIYVDNGDCTISGGTFNPTYDYAVVSLSSGTLSINGGSFEKAIYISGGKCLISGGTFITDVSEYCASGYKCIESDGKYIVQAVVCPFEGSGTEVDPYLIANESQFKEIGYWAGANEENKIYFKLTDNIAMSGGSAYAVTKLAYAVLDGGNYKVTLAEGMYAIENMYNSTVKNINFTINDGSVVWKAQGENLFENVDVSGYLTTAGNEAAYVVYCASSTISFSNCVSYAVIDGFGGSTDYNAIFVGYVYDDSDHSNILNFKNCINAGSITCGRASMFIANPASNIEFALNVENCKNGENGKIISTYVDDNYNMNYYVSVRSNCPSIILNGEKINVDDPLNNFSNVKDDTLVGNDNPSGVYNGPINTGMALTKNKNGTYTIIPINGNKVNDVDVAYYEVGSGLYVSMSGGGSSRFYATERINSTGAKKYTSILKDLEFVDSTFVNGDQTSTLAGNTTFTRDGVTYYVVDAGLSTGGVEKGATIYYLSAFDADGNLLGTVTLSGETIVEPVAAIGTVKYETIQEAVAAATTGQTIKLLSDVTLEENLTIAADKNFTLDLCGNTLTAFNDNNKRILIDGSVEVKNGTIADGTTYDEAVENTAAMIRVRNNGSLTIANSATVTGSYYLIFPSQNAKLVVNGKVHSDNGASAISTNGSNKDVQDYTSAGVSIVVNDGAEITSGGEAGIYLPSGTLTVNGGSITGQTGIAAKGGFIKINNGVITGTGASSGFVHNKNGWNNTGDALAVGSSDYPYSPVSVQVTGGRFVSTYAKAVATYSSDAGKYETATKFISGGIFSTEVDAGYIADGYEAKPDNGMYKVVKKQLTIASDVEQSENKDVTVTTDNSQTAGTAEVKKDNGETATEAETAVANKIHTQVSAGSANLVDLSTATKSVEETITAEKIEGLRTSTESTVNAAALDELIKGAKNGTVDFEVRSYVKTEVVRVETDENNHTLIKGIKVNMTPYYNVYVQKEGSTPETAVKVYKEDQILEVKVPVTVTMDVPEGYTVTGDITVLHIKEDGSTYTYTGKYDAATKKISFVNEHGFSEFYLTSGIDEALVMYTPVSGDARYFSTFAEALDCVVRDGDKITLLKDVALTADDKDGAATNCLAIDNGKTFTIDLGGKTFTGRLNIRHGNVTVKNGNMENDSQPLNIYGSTDAVASDYSVLTIDKTATITAKTNTVCMMQADGAKTYGAVINVNGKVIATNERFDDAAVYISGNIGNDDATDKSAMTSNNIVNINGTVIGGNTMAIAMSGQATVNVADGAAVSGSTAIGVKRGVLNVADGTTISATGAKIDPAEANTNGSEDTGAAISVTSTYNNYGTIAVNVNGGTISSANNAAVYVGHSSANKPFVQGATVSVNAGTLVSAEGVPTVYVADAIVGDAANYTKAVIPGTSTATFSNNVSEYAEAGYETVANAEGKYVVTPKTFVVAVQSRIQGTDNTVTTVTGGGNITYGNSTTVSAPTVNGYTFVGWFIGYSSSGNGTKVSTDLSFTYTPSDDTTLTAVYALKSGQMFKLSVTGSKFRYSTDGGASWSTTQKSEMNAEFDANTVITLKFIGNTDETFRDWVNASDKIVSTDKDGYTFTLVCDTVLKAHYSDEEEGTALVSFKSAYGQVIAARTYSATDTISFPAAPSKMGSKFTGWSMSEAEIKASIAANRYIEVTPTYEASGETYTVTVRYEGVEKEDTVYADIAVGVGKTLEALAIDGYTFSCWKNSEGTIVSTNEKYAIRPISNVRYTAVYVSKGVAPVEKIPTIVMTNAFAKSDGSNKLSFTANRSVPEGYEVVEHGILYGVDSSFGGDNAKTLMVLGGSQVYKAMGNNNALDGTYTCNMPVGNSTSTVVYARGYMVLKKDGAVSYHYSDNILFGSFDSLHQ